MDMHWFDDVLVLLEEGNMTRAAARRNITQPAFSRRIRSFEDWLGVAVLDRKTNRVDLSPALVANEGEIRALMSRLRELRTNIAQYDSAGLTVAISAQHALASTQVPGLVQSAQATLPRLKVRLRAGNLSDCVSLFLRGDTSLMCCYEADTTGPMAFGAGVLRARLGQDRLVPVAGGALRYSLRENNTIAEDTPAIVYPETSYFGEVLHSGARPFGTAAFSARPVCETAFSSGMKELVLQGLGIGWLPLGMVRAELASGTLVALGTALGDVPLNIAIYAQDREATALRLLKLWAAPG